MVHRGSSKDQRAYSTVHYFEANRVLGQPGQQVIQAEG